MSVKILDDSGVALTLPRVVAWAERRHRCGPGECLHREHWKRDGSQGWQPSLLVTCQYLQSQFSPHHATVAQPLIIHSTMERLCIAALLPRQWASGFKLQ
jgi:hypothetical protein